MLTPLRAQYARKGANIESSTGPQVASMKPLFPPSAITRIYIHIQTWNARTKSMKFHAVFGQWWNHCREGVWYLLFVLTWIKTRVWLYMTRWSIAHRTATELCLSLSTATCMGSFSSATWGNIFFQDLEMYLIESINTTYRKWWCNEANTTNAVLSCLDHHCSSLPPLSSHRSDENEREKSEKKAFSMILTY